MLREEGPARDPTILLGAEAMIDGVAFDVRALRVRQGHRGPDFREEVPQSDYQDALDSLLDDIEDLVGSIVLSPVAISGAQYLLWMVPAATD
jgi:hypothetical protein